MNPVKITTLQNYTDEFGNEIVYAGAHHTPEVDIVFSGGGNRLIVDSAAKLQKIVIEFKGHGAEIALGASNARLAMLIGSKSKVSIGNGLSTTSAVYMTAFDGSSIEIGRDCMFAGQVQIRADDAHPIFDIETGERCNRARPIVIGDHVWLGEGCAILNGTEIGAGSVVGMRSVVKGRFPNNCVIAGVPAKVARRNVAWERPHLSREWLFHPDGTLKEVDKKYWHPTDIDE